MEICGSRLGDRCRDYLSGSSQVSKYGTRFIFSRNIRRGLFIVKYDFVEYRNLKSKNDFVGDLSRANHFTYRKKIFS